MKQRALKTLAGVSLFLTFAAVSANAKQPAKSG